MAVAEPRPSAATMRQRAEAAALAADALALIQESGMDAATIRDVVMADDHDVHAIRSGRYAWDPAASFAIEAPHRATQRED